MRDVTRTIWHGNDYVPEVVGDWVKDQRGGLWLALAGSRVVGVAGLTLVGRDEAWLHGLRVHPRWRRRGVARALMAFRLERAKRLGALIARLDTADHNTPIHRLMRRFGFRLISRYSFWRKPGRAGKLPRRASQRDLPGLWRLVRRGDPILHDEFVRRALTRDDIARAIRLGRCLVTGPEAHATSMALVEPSDERLRLRHLGGERRGVRELLALLPAEAARRGKDKSD